MKRMCEVNLYSFYDGTGLKNHLMRRGKEGWILDRVRGMLLWYRKDTPGDVSYDIVHFSKESMTEEKRRAFENDCQQKGWQSVGGGKNIQILINRQRNPQALPADAETEISAIQEISGRNMLPLVFFGFTAVMHFVLLFLKYSMDPVDVLADSVFMSIGLTFFLMFLYFGLDKIRYSRWMTRAEAASYDGKFIPTSKNENPVYVGFFLGGVFTFLLGLIGMTGINNQIWSFFLLTGILGAGFLRRGTAMLLKKELPAIGRKQTISVGFHLLVGVILIGVFIAGMASKDQWSRGNPPEGLVLSAAELSDTDAEQENQYSAVSRSFLLGRYKGWDTLTDKTSVVYDVMDCQSDALAEYCWNLLKNRDAHTGSDTENFDPEHPLYSYEPMDAEIWGAEEACRFYSSGEPKNTYLLRYGNCVAEIAFSWEPEEFQFRVVADRINDIQS